MPPQSSGAPNGRNHISTSLGRIGGNCWTPACVKSTSKFLCSARNAVRICFIRIVETVRGWAICCQLSASLHEKTSSYTRPRTFESGHCLSHNDARVDRAGSGEGEWPRYSQSGSLG